jgi:hypothetical protein
LHFRRHETNPAHARLHPIVNMALEGGVMTEFKPGDRVYWKSHGGEAIGTVVRKQTSDTKIKDHQVRASKDDPQYIVESDNGGRASHKPSALRKA